MDRYTAWRHVPDHLKTKTSLGRMGLKLSPDQEPAAIKTHWYYSISDYYLYEVSEAIPKRKLTQKQLDALAAARLKGRTCSRCGTVKRHHSYLNCRNGGIRLCDGCQYEVMINAARNSAIEWSRDFLAIEEVLILDTETTGLDDEQDEIIQLGIIDLQGNILFDSFFRPAVEVTPGASAVHGLTDEDLQGAPLFSKCYNEIVTIINGRPVLIYNADFDERLFMATINRYSLPYPSWFTTEFGYTGPPNWYCVMRQFARFYGEWSDYHRSYTWKSLAFAADYFGLSVEAKHEATADCLATLGVVRGMAGSEKRVK